ncbi:fimbrial protein [Yersinia enterocolitica]|uniref:fimbrial protein n=1 Tax=Yersinia enterocolitica TaxID=630 RepID=UPI00097875A1|nr:fimbrial protein [Yersinia enterocolitica]ELI7921275.1 fimbrial protein [Yersinia enterocolitica]HEN3580537.1 fimbrial protein [Yersinia enterocolitica]HEN3613778.1 fimbrial protein [Yersinia enterocolitica]HEN3639318.1 fimbrial protein [Yersinia enterocolitica]HEN3647595.1 fimbrial protein [Yersinia enterocolitica]
MKNNLIAVALLTSSAISTSAFAADGQVNFTGEIIDSACEVVNSPSNPLEVNMGRVNKTAFGGTGSTASATQFALQLRNCPATVSTASVKFDGTAVNGNRDVLALTSTSGVATGVGIQLYDVSDSALPLATPSMAYSLVSGMDNSLSFTARYIQTAALVTAGPANATASFTVNYN